MYTSNTHSLPRLGNRYTLFYRYSHSHTHKHTHIVDAYINSLYLPLYLSRPIGLIYLSLPIPQENQSLLGVSDPDSAEWQAYTDYIDRMVLGGFSSAVRCSLLYLMENTDPSLRISPLFEVQLVLKANEMTFEPSLDPSHHGNFYDIIDKMVGNITNMTAFIPRVAKHKQLDNYQVM